MSRRLPLFLLLPLLAASAPALAEDVALVGGEVHVGDGTVLKKATVLVRGSRIAEVGADVEVPAGARTIDCAGRIVTPGLIDADTSLGLASADRTDGRMGPDARAADAVDRWDARFATALREGVTSLLVTGSAASPSGGAAALVSTAPPPGEVVEERGPLVLNLSTSARAGGLWGAERRAAVRKLLVRARDQRDQLARWRRDLEAYEGKRLAAEPTPEERLLLPPELVERMGRWSPADRTAWRAAAYKSMGRKFEKPSKPAKPPSRPRTDASLDDLVDALGGQERAVLFHAELDADVEAALGIAREFRLRAVVAGGAGLLRHAKRLAGGAVRVVVTHVGDAGHHETGPLARRPDDLVAQLVRAGVRPALGSGGSGGRFLRLLAARRVGMGVDPADALQAITLRAAEAAGVADRLGTVAAGKRADVVVWTGDPFSVASRAAVVLVAGSVVHE